MAIWSARLTGLAEIFGVMAAGVIAYAMLALLHPQRQFLHDAICGTRLVTWRPLRVRQSSLPPGADARR